MISSSKGPFLVLGKENQIYKEYPLTWSTNFLRIYRRVSDLILMMSCWGVSLRTTSWPSAEVTAHRPRESTLVLGFFRSSPKSESFAVYNKSTQTPAHWSVRSQSEACGSFDRFWPRHVVGSAFAIFSRIHSICHAFGDEGVVAG